MGRPPAGSRPIFVLPLGECLRLSNRPGCNLWWEFNVSIVSKSSSPVASRHMCANDGKMNNQVRPVEVRAVLPLEGSFAVFLGDKTKTFVIYVDESVGTAISMFMRGVPKERPLTHDLMGHVMRSFGASVERVVINDVQGSVFYARLILAAENELGARKVVELDARPSDSIAMAMQQGAPILVAQKVWDSVEDVSQTLEEVEKRGLHTQQAGEEEITEDDESDDDADEDDDEDGDFDFEFDDDDDADKSDDDEDEGDDTRPGSSTY